MHIFLTYASEQKSAAETIALSLRSRGFKVFLDKDDLPPGRSYDEQIEKAIKTADYLIFMVSPQSVQQGRYTRTELEFARRKWRNPDGRILPVMAVPTDLASVPEFLRAVTILDPKGNIAAEVASYVTTTDAHTSRNLITWFAVAGLISGVLTVLTINMPGQNLLYPLLPHPLYPPIFFGALLAAVFLMRLQTQPIQLLAVLVIVQGAWQLAVASAVIVDREVALRSTVSAEGDILRHLKEGATAQTDPVEASPPPQQQQQPEARSSLIDQKMILPGLAGGLVGGLGTWLAGMVATFRLRSVETALTATTAGGIAGLLAIFGSSWLLYAGWQCMVAASLGYGIARSR